MEFETIETEHLILLKLDAKKMNEIFGLNDENSNYKKQKKSVVRFKSYNAPYQLFSS